MNSSMYRQSFSVIGLQLDVVTVPPFVGAAQHALLFARRPSYLLDTRKLLLAGILTHPSLVC